MSDVWHKRQSLKYTVRRRIGISPAFAVPFSFLNCAFTFSHAFSGSWRFNRRSISVKKISKSISGSLKLRKGCNCLKW